MHNSADNNENMTINKNIPTNQQSRQSLRQTQYKVDSNVNTHMIKNEEDLYNVQTNPTSTQQVLIGNSFQ